MNVAALLQDSPSDDSHRRRQPPPPSNSGNGTQEQGERGVSGGGGSGGGGGERGEQGERGGGGNWGYERDRTRVSSQNQNTWPPPYPARASQSSPTTPISTDTSPYAHPKDASWTQPVGNPYPSPVPPPPGSAPYDQPPPSSSRMRTGSNASVHGPPTTGPGVPPPAPSGPSYMPPPSDYAHTSPHHMPKPPPSSSTSTPLYPTPVPVAGQPRLAMSNSPPIGGSPYASGPPPPVSSTPRRPQSQLTTPQPPHAHGPPSSHPSPAMASLQNPGLPSSPWGPVAGVPGPAIVDGRERELRDRTHPALTSERDRDRAVRERDMSLPIRDRERDWDSPRDPARRKTQPTGPGVPPPLAGPGTGAPPPLGPGVPPMVGPGIPDDPHKISSTSAPASSGPSRAHSRSQLTKDEIMEHGKDMERSSRLPERDMPPTGPGRTPDFPPPHNYPYRGEPGEIPGSIPPPSRRDREEFTGPGGLPSSSRFPPPPADYRSSNEYGREPPLPPDYRREQADYRRPPDMRETGPTQRGDYRREPPPADYRRDPPPPSTDYRRDAPPPVDYRRDPAADYRDHRRDNHPPVEYRREPPPGDYRRETHPPEYRTPADYRDARRDLQPPPGSGHSPETYRREPEYRRERESQDYPSSRRNSNEQRRDRDRMMTERDMRERERDTDPRRGESGSGPGIPPGERQPRRSPHQTRDMDRDPYLRRNEEYRREPPPGQVPHDYRGPPPQESYRAEYRPSPADYRREPPPPPDYPRREHHPHPQDYRRDEYPLRQSHGPPGPQPPSIHPGQEMRGPPPLGPPGEYRRDPPPGPPQDYRRDIPPSEYRGAPGPLPPPNDYPPRQGPPPHNQDYRGRESSDAVAGQGGRDYPRRDREREPHPRDSADFSRPPPGDFPRRREEGGEYMGRSAPPPGSMPPGPGVPGRTATPNSEVYVKHPSEHNRERERWEREHRERGERGERGHYPPSQQPGGSGGPPPPQSANAPPHHQHNHSHSHSKGHPHHHHGPHHHHVIHSHPHGNMPPGGPPIPSGGPPSGPGGSDSRSQVGPPPPSSQGGAQQQQPSQRQLQSQFPTRFVSVNTHAGSRMGSPVPGGPPGPGGVVGPGGGTSGGPVGVRKDMSGGQNVNAGKDMKKMSRSGGPPGGPPGPGSGGRRDGRDEREMKEREMHPSYPQQPPPPGQPIPHREQGRVLGHGYPHAGPHGSHGPPYGDESYMVVDDMEREHREREQQMQMQNQHPLHPNTHPHAHAHARPLVFGPSVQHTHQQHLVAPQVGYYPSQEPSVEELWGPPQEQPDREVKSKFKIDLGTFVFPNTPFPYHFDVGEWVGVSGVNGAVKDEAGRVDETEKKEGEKEKEGDVGKQMDIDGKGVKEKMAEKETVVEGEAREKDGEKAKEQQLEKEKEREKEKDGEIRAIEKTSSHKEEIDDMLDVETRATILIPNGHLPREKPPKPAIWGGGVIGRPISPQRRPSSSSKDDKSDSLVRPRKRRIYSDDSDLFLCALHSGWLTWSGSARARDKGQDLRVEVRVIRCAGAGAGSVYAVGAGAHAGKYAPAMNNVITTNGAYQKKNGNGKSPVVRKEELVGRFIGGWGERCFVKDSDTETDEETENDEENDGRGLVSAGWGSGHDGSAIEVLKAEFVNKNTARAAPGTGRRNRSQRLSEYNERRAAVLGLQRLAAPTRLAGRKRRRTVGGWMSVRRLPNANVLDANPELQEDEMTEDEQQQQQQQATTMPLEPEKKDEAQLMAVRTVMFGTGLAGDMRLGYKYDPDVLKDILFPISSTPATDRPARKRRRTTVASIDILMEDPEESEPPPPTPNRPVILETAKESYLLSLTHGSEFSSDGRRYDISLILEGEVAEDREDAVVLVVADKNVVKAVETPPPSPPADDEEPGEIKEPLVPDTSMESTTAAKLVEEDAQEQSRPPSPVSTAPRTNTQTINTESSRADAAADSVSTAKTIAMEPPPSAEDISMVDASASKSGADKHEPPTNPIKKFKHPVAQVLQRRVGENMFRFTEEGISIADGEDGMPTDSEWLVQVKSWKWATRKIVKV